MTKLTEKKLCDICEKIVKIQRLQGSGITEDIFKGVKKAKAVVKNLNPVGKKLVKDLVKAFNQGKISLEEAINQANPVIQTHLSKSGSGFTSNVITAESIGSGAVVAGEGGYTNLPLGTATSQDGEGAVIAGERRGDGMISDGFMKIVSEENKRKKGKGAVVAGEGSFPKHSVGKGKVNPWMVHLKAFREANPRLSYKQAMIEAKKYYRK